MLIMSGRVLFYTNTACGKTVFISRGEGEGEGEGEGGEGAGAGGCLLALYFAFHASIFAFLSAASKADACMYQLPSNNEAVPTNPAWTYLLDATSYII